MSILRTLAAGFRSPFRKKRDEAELNEELAGYFESLVAEKMQTGITREQAVRAAHVEMGSVDAVKDGVRDVGWERSVAPVWKDILFGLRMMRKSPGFTTVAVLTLALGIGANSAMFGIVYGLLYRPLPFPDDARLAAVHMNFSPQNNPRGTMSIADFVDWKDSNTAFEKVAAYSSRRFTLTGQGQAEEVAGVVASADYFAVLGIAPIQGRTFQSGDDAAAAPNYVVISNSLWQRRFAGAGSAIGRVIDVDGSPATIIGVINESFYFPRPQVELWQNLHLKVTRRGPFFYRGIGRLRPGATLQSAQAEANVIGRNIERANPTSYTNLNMPVESLHSYLVGDLRPALFMLFAAVLVVLLIAIVNLANLLLARATTREREMAVRMSLGAGRRRLMQQLLTENILLSLFGAAVGWLVALAGIRLFRAFGSADIRLSYQVELGWSVLFFTVGIAVAAGVLFGLVPALQSTREDLQSALKDGGRSGSAGARHHRIRSILVIAEISLSLVLVVAAGLLLRSFISLQRADVGTTAPPANVLTMMVTPKSLHQSRNSPSNEDQAITFYQRVMEDVGRLPGVQYVAISDSLPPDYAGEDDTFSIAGRPWSDQEFPSTTLPKVSPDYFRALGVPLLRGRFFTPDDTATSQPVTIISESLARRYFPGVDPIGQKIGASGPTNTDPYMDVVGIVGDLKYDGPESEFRPAYYRPYTQNFSTTIFLMVRSSRPAADLGTVIQREIHSVDNDAVVRRVLTLEDLLSESVAQPRFRTLLLTGFGALALLLASVGIYGVISFSVTQRVQEIGIRMALGAQRFDVLKMILQNGAFLASVGIGIGLIGSFGAAHAVSRFLFATRVNDPLTLTAGCLLLSIVALAATLIPAVRATKIDPQVALRHE